MKAASRITMTSIKPSELKLRSLIFVSIIKGPAIKSVIKGTVAIAVTIKFQPGERSRPKNISFMKSTKEKRKRPTLQVHNDIHRLASTQTSVNRPYKMSSIKSLTIFSLIEQRTKIQKNAAMSTPQHSSVLTSCSLPRQSCRAVFFICTINCQDITKVLAAY